MIPGATSFNFKDSELACKHCGVNGCHPILVDALENFRTLVGKPVIVDSAYRCPEHNAAIGGAPKSEHAEGLAADIRVDGMTAAQMETIARKIPAIKGIGRDDHKRYIHVDVREHPAFWCYSEEGKWCTYYLPAFS